MTTEPLYVLTVDEDRHRQPLEEIIVDFAKITCTCAQSPTGGPIEKRVKGTFRVPSGHGIFGHGHACAHDQNCVSIENVPKFNNCYAKQYIVAVSAMPQTAETAEALAIAKSNLSISNQRLGPCIPNLIEQWMDPDEKKVFSNYFDFIKEPIKEVNNFIIFREFIYRTSKKLNAINPFLDYNKKY